MTGSVLLHSRKVQTEALDKTLSVLGETPADSADPAQEVRWLMEDCVRAADRLKAAFDDGQKRWPATPVEDVHEFYTEFLAVVDRQLQLAGRLREQARQSSETGGEAFDLKPLDESIESLGKLKETVSGLCEWLISPTPPSDEPLSTPEERLAAFERGEYEDIEDIYKRVLAGGPLVKE